MQPLTKVALMLTAFPVSRNLPIVGKRVVVNIDGRSNVSEYFTTDVGTVEIHYRIRVRSDLFAYLAQQDHFELTISIHGVDRQRRYADRIEAMGFRLEYGKCSEWVMRATATRP